MTAKQFALLVHCSNKKS
jgi:hypothetical protein